MIDREIDQGNYLAEIISTSQATVHHNLLIYRCK